MDNPKLSFEVPEEMEVRGINWNPRIASNIAIHVNGQEVKRVTYYSIPKGLVKFLAADEKGRLILAPDRQSVLVLEQTGTITIHLYP